MKNDKVVKMFTTVLKIEKLPHNKNLPEYKTNGASGMDLYAAIENPITLKSLERALIPTGIKIELEQGFEAQIRPRSGLSIKPEERIAQMIIAHVEKAEIKVVTSLSDTARATGGFGSTGK